LRTDELNNRTGILYRLLALSGTVMLERSSLGVTVGIARGHVEVVEDLAPLDEPGWDLDRKLTQKLGHHIPPRLQPHLKVEHASGQRVCVFEVEMCSRPHLESGREELEIDTCSSHYIIPLASISRMGNDQAGIQRVSSDPPTTHPCRVEVSNPGALASAHQDTCSATDSLKKGPCSGH